MVTDAVKGLIMPFKRFPEFGKELKRPFEVHENCYDCADFYGDCKGWRASRAFACEDFNRLPDVMPGTYGQRFPASRRSGLAKCQSADENIAADGDTHAEVASLSRAIHKAKVRACGCGAILPTGRRLCDQCRTQNRRATMRDYMRTRRAGSGDSRSDSGVPFPAAAMRSTQAGGGDLVLTGRGGRVPLCFANNCITNAF